MTGAGRGIGAASALALAEAGAHVVLSSRTKEQLDAVAEQVEALGRKAVVVPADLSDLDAVAGLAEVAARELGRIDIVVNNVGGTMPRPFLDTSPSRLIREFSWNVATAHALTRAAVPTMLETGGGAVVGISSMMGRTAGRGFVAYGTAKAGLSHWTRLAAQDLAPRIRVNAIAVGSIATSALEIVLEDDDLRTTMEQGTPLRSDRRPRGDRRHRPVPRLGRRRLHHRQGDRGRRRHRAAQPRHGPPRSVTHAPWRARSVALRERFSAPRARSGPSRLRRRAVDGEVEHGEEAGVGLHHVGDGVDDVHGGGEAAGVVVVADGRSRARARSSGGARPR